MTVLKGKDLIIMADGVAFAAAKSCDIEVNCDVIPVSSPGYVSNVTITQQSYTPTSSSKYYWDTTRKKFVVSNGATLNPKYYLSWSGGYDYMNPEMRLFSYSGDYLTVANGELVKEILEGSAICKTAKVTATVGNLAQGSMVFQGKGALSNPTT